MATKCIAKVGDIVTFDYRNTKTLKRKVTGRIISVRDITKDKLSEKTLWYNNIKRGKLLLTIQEDNGNIRSFYNSVMRNPRKIVFAERVIRWFSGKGSFKVVMK